MEVCFSRDEEELEDKGVGEDGENESVQMCDAGTGEVG